MTEPPSQSPPEHPARQPGGPASPGILAGEEEVVDFGFARVPRAARDRLVGDVFQRVANRYDLMNDLMSAGLHRLWKNAMVSWLAPRAGRRYVDLAGGTGDIAFRIRDRIAETRRALPASAGTGTEPPVWVTDINPAMLAQGRARAEKRLDAASFAWVVASAEDLPFAPASVDGITMAFGLRNVTRISRALREARRVLRPGGRFLCLEFSRVTVPVLSELYERYSFGVVPWMGEMVAHDRAAYQYLVESIRRFPAQDHLADMMAEAGLARVSYRNLSGGIVAMHSGWRL